MAFTESVRSFQVPATPGTIAWPPSLPSVPTSRATRVTSDANDRSWSTMVLMASLSCRISPRTSTVILRDRSPLATAMVTSEMLRTWAVRLLAIELTDSVSSRHTPVTSLTLAWPPSLPSVPTSRATRVTSEVNTESCLIMVLTMLAERRNSPLSGRPSTSSRTVCSRSPCATAEITRVTSVVGHTRSSIRLLTELSISPQAAVEMPNFTRWRVRPCSPTALPMRSSCWAMFWLAATISLNSTQIRPRAPSLSRCRRTEKSPARMPSMARSSSRRSEACWAPLREAGGTVEPLAGETVSMLIANPPTLQQHCGTLKSHTDCGNPSRRPITYPATNTNAAEWLRLRGKID